MRLCIVGRDDWITIYIAIAGLGFIALVCWLSQVKRDAFYSKCAEFHTEWHKGAMHPAGRSAPYKIDVCDRWKDPNNTGWYNWERR